jgi:2-oxoglutarate dehydrogenase E1 component
MENPTFATRYNLDLIEGLYTRWRQDHASVEPSWQAFFEGFALASDGALLGQGAAQTAVVRLIYAYRDLGHFLAHLDPLNEPPKSHPLLELSRFGLRDADLDRTFDTSEFHGLPRATLRELLAALRETYCRTIGVEYLHIQDTNIRHWLRDRMEPRRNRPNLPLRQKLRTLMTLHFAELFEKFLQTRYVGQKRFSLEGAETLIPVLDAMIEKSPNLEVKEFVIGMAHRGRLNVLANILQKPYQEIFAEFEENFLPDSIDGDGDVKYHLGFSNDFVTASGRTVHLSLSPNPSHLEAVDPVVEGRTRAKQRAFGDSGRTHGVPLLIHGDAAFAGQGIVAETLNLSNLAGYTTGGTLHVIVNNQIGFTTSPSDARSTTYCTDVAKMIQAPIFHVNAEDPEACVYVAELALDFRQAFHRDVVIDLYCYRRHGHNEGDEPSFTQPLMYRQIKDRPSISAIYTEQLLKNGELKLDEAQAIDQEFQAKLQKAQQEVKAGPPRRHGMKGFAGAWQGLQQFYSAASIETGVPRATLQRITQHLTRVPEGFTLNPKVARLLEARRTDMEQDRPIDWAFAEALAFGSLVAEGTSVRLTGQDSRRGTFSQRHAVLVDMQTGDRYVPLDTLNTSEGVFFAIYDSLLSEEAVLGFEYGYSLDAPQTLVLWEAQFGDFANGAQSIIDQFIAAGESKWQRASGVVLLLPHGYEGQGPEHSSARLERFLQMCAEENMQVCNLTTPAQYFHLLRRQVRRDFRKPLVVMTPKSLLRHKEAVSPIEELVTGRFREVIDDREPPGLSRRDHGEPERVRRVILCSGKVFYDLWDARTERQAEDIAIVRVEQFYPFPEKHLRQTLARYRQAREFVWAQEESHNMGGWSFMEPRLRAMGHQPLYVGRDASASPAVGSLAIHLREQKELVDAALGGPVPHLVSSHHGKDGKPAAPVKDMQPESATA